MQISTRQGVLTALIGILISLFGAMIQFLMIYWILNAYGTEFNGFIRIASALALLGGTTEGALGVTTVVMLMKPMANNDWIEANEIFSTARKKYHQSILSGAVLIILIAILYPIELAVAPAVLNGDGVIKWGIQLTQGTNISIVPVWQLVGIILVLGSKEVISAGFFGIYENVLMADQKNMVRKTIVLLADTIVYGLLFFLMNLTIDGGKTIAPIIPFLVLVIYAPIRGYALKLYVRRFYPWLKYYHDFNNYTLVRSSTKMWKASIGQSIIINSDIIILFVVLGTSGLSTTSMLSLYLIVAVNVRLILTNLIISFREYFIGVLAKEGRLYWEAYSKYELYTFVIAALSFIFMSLIAPYIVTGLYGQVVANDLINASNQVINNVSGNKVHGLDSNELLAQKEAFKFIFSSRVFSGLYGAGTAFILLFQGQMTLIQAKRRFGDVANKLNYLAGFYIFVQLAVTLSIVLTTKNNPQYINQVLLAFYIIKLTFMSAFYIYLWQYTWKYVTYNSTFKYIFTNVLSLVLPIIASIFVNIFFIAIKLPLEVKFPTESTIELTPVTVPILLTISMIVGLIGFAATLIIPMILRPSVGISLILALPILKQIVARTKEESRLYHLQNLNVNIEALYGDQKATILRALNGIDDDQENEIDELAFFEKYQATEKPKIYKVKGIKKPN